MRAVIYRVGRIDSPELRTRLKPYELGIAYSTKTHFINFFVDDPPDYRLLTGLVITESHGSATKRSVSNLSEWISERFLATNIKEMRYCVGTVIEGLWQPGLNDWPVLDNLKIEEFRKSQQVLKSLLNKLDDILDFIEPSKTSLDTFGNKSRELLILSCTEVENYWVRYLKIANYKKKNGHLITRDYFELKEIMSLDKYMFKMPRYSGVGEIRPFSEWSKDKPTQSIPWYNSYNETKHNRDHGLSAATLIHCINAVAAVICMFTVSYGPYSLIQGNGSIGQICSELFQIELDKKLLLSCYVPKVNVKTTVSTVSTSETDLKFATDNIEFLKPDILHFNLL